MENSEKKKDLATFSADDEIVAKLSDEEIDRELIELADTLILNHDESLKDAFKTRKRERWLRRREQFEYTDENLNALDRANQLLCASVRKMLRDVQELVETRKAKLDTMGIAYKNYISATLFIESFHQEKNFKLDEDDDGILEVMDPNYLSDFPTLCECSFTIQNGKPTEETDENQLLWLQLPGDERLYWNIGLDMEKTDYLHLCYPFHVMWDHSYMTIEDIC